MASIDKRIVKLVETLERIGLGASSSYIHRLIMHMIDEELSRHEERYEARQGKAKVDEPEKEPTHCNFKIGDKVWWSEADSEDTWKGTGVIVEFNDTRTWARVDGDESWKGWAEIDSLHHIDEPKMTDEPERSNDWQVGDQVWFLGELSGKIHKGTIKKLFPLTQNALMVMSDSHWGCAEISQLQWDNNNLTTRNDNLNILKGVTQRINHLILGSEYWWMDTTNAELPCKRWGNLVGVLNDKPDGVTALIAESRYSNEMGQTFVLHRVNPANLTVKGH